jgi:hypothetical protein
VRSILRAAITAITLVVATACGEGEDASRTFPDHVTGVVIEIDAEGFDDVNGFVLKDGDDRYEIFVSERIDYGFPLSHLNAHRAGGEPVRVELDRRDGRLVALSIEDA